MSHNVFDLLDELKKYIARARVRIEDRLVRNGLEKEVRAELVMTFSELNIALSLVYTIEGALRQGAV